MPRKGASREKTMPGAGTKTKIRRTAWLTAALWTALIATLGAWHHHRFQDQYYELGRVYARAAHAKDLIYRKWNAFHGGVYVPVTKSLQPNPYLDVPHRDVVTSAGQKLTLVNPPPT